MPSDKSFYQTKPLVTHRACAQSQPKVFAVEAYVMSPCRKGCENEMNTFVALFRGINVGGKNILPMKELTAVLEGLGLKKVQTYIQSGNVVFQSDTNKTDELSREIGAAINKSHEFTPQVFILSIQELSKAMASNPFPECENKPKSLHLFFLNTSPSNPDVKRLASLQSESERFKLVGKVFYLHAPDGVGRSKLAANVEKSLGVALTARNWRSAGTILSMAREVTA